MEEDEIAEVIESVRKNLDLFALVGNRLDWLEIRNKNNHFIKLIEDTEGHNRIVNSLIQLGIEVYPSYEVFEKKYPRKPHYPKGFPKLS